MFENVCQAFDFTTFQIKQNKQRSLESSLIKAKRDIWRYGVSFITQINKKQILQKCIKM